MTQYMIHVHVESEIKAKWLMKQEINKKIWSKVYIEKGMASVKKGKIEMSYHVIGLK